MAINPDGDELERDLIVQTPTQTLQSIGKMQVATTAGAFGATTVQAAVSVTDNYKREQRAQATGGEIPEDTNGLGYQFTNITNSQV